MTLAVDVSSPALAHVDPPAEPLRGLRMLRTVVRNPIETWPASVYEEPILHTPLFGRPVTFVMRPDLVRAVLVDEADSFEKAEAMRRALDPALKEAILTAEGARWRWQRRAAAPIFRHERILGFVPTMAQVTEEALARWRKLPVGAEIDVAHEMMRTTFDIIVETMLSGRAGLDVDAFERAITAYLETTSWPVMLTMIRAPRWTPYPGKRRAFKARQFLHREMHRLVAQRRRRGDEGRTDLLTLLLSAKDAETGQQMSDEDVVANLLTFTVAGHETTALALTWTMYLLSHHPDVANRIRAEIDAVAGDAQIGVDHVDQLAYTRQVISEAMRLYPPAPIVVRAATRDVQLGEHTIVKGTGILIPIYAVHRHKALWDNPDAFDPERFTPERVKARDRYAYLPFGAGPRICIGMSFALVEAVVILATVVRHAQLDLRPGHMPQLKTRITLRPASGMPMRVASRADQAASMPSAKASA